MSSERVVVGLHGVTVPGTREPDPEIVAALEQMLEKARAGQIHGLGYVNIRDDHVITGWVGKADRHYMLAGASRLQWRMAADYESDG